VRQEQPEDFFFLQITDTHTNSQIDRADMLREFARRVPKLPIPVAFVVNTGDLDQALDGRLPEQANFKGYLSSSFALFGGDFFQE